MNAIHSLEQLNLSHWKLNIFFFWLSNTQERGTVGVKLIPSKAQLIFLYKVQKKYWPRSVETVVLTSSDICPKS